MDNNANLSYAQFTRAFIQMLDTLGIEYLIGGAVAVWAWGEPRATQDLDLVIDLPPEKAYILSQALEELEIFLPVEIILEYLTETRADLPIDAIHGKSGYKAEMFLLHEGDDLRKTALEHKRLVNFGPEIGETYIHSPEDLIIYKLLYYSLSHQTKHIRDIAAILEHQGNRLEIEYIETWANKKGVIAIWREILNQLDQEKNGSAHFPI